MVIKTLQAPLRWETGGFTVAPTGVSSSIIISAITVSGRRGNNRLEGEGFVRSGHSSCSADLHGEQRWRSRHESPERQRGHRRGREPESKCGRLSDAAHSVTGMAHPAVQRFITGDTSNVQMKTGGPCCTGEYLPAEHRNTDTDVSSLPPYMQTY